MKYVIIIPFILLSVISKSQESAPDLITDRPDQTESSSVVPIKSLQIETGFLVENHQTNIFTSQSLTYNTSLLRYGLFNNFELRLGLDYSDIKTKINNTNISTNAKGLSPLYTGFKIKIHEEDGLIPELAFLGGLVLPFTANQSFRPDYSAANIRFAFSHTLSDRISLGYNLGAEWDGESAIPGYFYSLALGFGLTENLGMFAEGYGLIQETGDAEHLADAGFTYLITSNFQIDLSGGLGLNDNAIDNFISFGLTYRLPK